MRLGDEKKDATLTRCFGVKKRVVDCDWKYLSTLRTLKSPHEPMPTLVDLLEFLALPGNADAWVLLDIKVHNTPFIQFPVSNRANWEAAEQQFKQRDGDNSPRHPVGPIISQTVE